MTATPPLKPWREVVRLKDELRNNALPLSEFAADLYEAALRRGRQPVYEAPETFFALTYPTLPLRGLVRDVALRLSGRGEKAVRQLELTYGGGKTHTLIALYHLFRDPGALPDLPAVREFREHVGAQLPRAEVATLCFDKIDVEKGIEGVRAPNGETRTLLHPWSVLAWQLAGEAGLRSIHAGGAAAERDTPPAEPLLTELLEAPRERGRATLVLADEVLMYAREKAGIDKVWGERLQDFFQYLTQAAARAPGAAVVASLLATDPAKARGALGRAMETRLLDVFRRQREEGVLPVGKEDVAEVLRRRFFRTEDIRDTGAFRAHAIGAVRELEKLDPALARNRAAAERRFLASFPFHPDLTDAFYSRWTQIPGFQRTRGILRVLATALRDAEAWDDCPLAGPSALLAPPGRDGLSEAARELAGIASAGGGERRADWPALLDIELAKAREIQDELPALRAGREAEQAVVAVFLHSPNGGMARTPDVLRLAGTRAPDPIELKKGLLRWRQLSWFLDDEDMGRSDPAEGELPKTWRLGDRPNLRQMYDEAWKRIADDAADAELAKTIGDAKALAAGAREAGAETHMLPAAPREVGDNGAFRFVVLGPEAETEAGRPGAVARRYLDEAGPGRPRVCRNALVLAVPSPSGLAAARDAARALLAWEDVQEQLAGVKTDPLRAEQLRRRLRDARAGVPDAVRHGWTTVVTVNEDNEAEAFGLRGSSEPLFAQIAAEPRARIKTGPVDAAALLPGGPWDLWRDGEEARFVKDFAEAFARFPRLPKIPRAGALRDTVLQGVKRGLLVARLARPDGSVRTWWREDTDAEARGDAKLEVALPARAELSRLSDSLLAPGALPELWPEDASPGAAGGVRESGTAQLPLARVHDYFRGGVEIGAPDGGGEDDDGDPLIVPRCAAGAVAEAVAKAVERGAVWLVDGAVSAWKEPVPALGAAAALRPPPDPILPAALLPGSLPGAWRGGETNGAALLRAASQLRGGAPLPWGLVREIVGAALGRWLELADGSGPLDCEFDRAGNVRLKPAESGKPPPPPPEAVLDLHGIEELADAAPELLNASAGAELRFRLRAAFEGAASPEVRARVDALLAKVSETLKTQ